MNNVHFPKVIILSQAVGIPEVETNIRDRKSVEHPLPEEVRDGMFWDRRMKPMPEPEQGLVKSWETFRERRKNCRMFTAGKMTSNVLTNTHLDTYM